MTRIFRIFWKDFEKPSFSCILDDLLFDGIAFRSLSSSEIEKSLTGFMIAIHGMIKLKHFKLENLIQNKVWEYINQASSNLEKVTYGNFC